MKNHIGRFCDAVRLFWDFALFILFIAACMILKEEICDD